MHDKDSRQPSDSNPVECLKDMTKLPGQSPVHLSVDALDECPNTHTLPSPCKEVLSLVEQLIKSEIPHLRIYVSSRPEADIKAVLETLTHIVSFHDESGETQDIKTISNRSLIQLWKG